jgi:hypothetical protein
MGPKATKGLETSRLVQRQRGARIMSAQNGITVMPSSENSDLNPSMA